MIEQYRLTLVEVYIKQCVPEHQQGKAVCCFEYVPLWWFRLVLNIKAMNLYPVYIHIDAVYLCWHALFSYSQFMHHSRVAGAQRCTGLPHPPPHVVPILQNLEFLLKCITAKLG